MTLKFYSQAQKKSLLASYSFSRAIFDKHQHLLRLELSKDEKYRVYTPLKKISPLLIKAILLQEDQHFYRHWGVNPIALVRAAWQTYILKSRRVGASTITMQLARLLYPLNSRKLFGKIEQIGHALALELRYSKAELLESYLNLAPYGANIEGIAAASLIYFNKSPEQLTSAEALTLAIIPQNPKKFSHDLQKKYPAHKNFLNANPQRRRLVARWLKEEVQAAAKKQQFELPLAIRKPQQLPFLAPHFVQTLLKDKTIATMTSIHSTLDLKLQERFSFILKNYLRRTKAKGIANAAILLVDSRDQSVQVMLGSGDFFNQEIQGQINGVEIKRSPGSTLKPFIYSLAIDQGLIHPNTVLKDVPQNFGSYRPDNFDYDFMGPVKAKDALRLSRNIPAIELNSRLKKTTLYQLLEEAQVTKLHPPSFYGLALALGGVEVSMHELVSMYTIFSNGGIWRPLRLRTDQALAQGKRLISPEAAFLIKDILQAPVASKNFSYSQQNQSVVAWKTGTSSGFRDAWTIGMIGPYVMGVWLGNFDNTSNHSLIGKEIAAPLFFELVEFLQEEKKQLLAADLATRNNIAVLNLKQIEVCKASGLLPTRYCVEREKTWFIPGKSPIKSDNVFREIAINPTTGLRTCHINSKTRFKIYEFWPSDLLKLFKKAGIVKAIPPASEPGCYWSNSLIFHPRISSPQSGLRYIKSLHAQLKTKIPLTAVSDGEVRFLYWFANDSFLAKTKPNQSFFWDPEPGTYVIRVLDDHGLSDAIDVSVQLEN